MRENVRISNLSKSNKHRRQSLLTFSRNFTIKGARELGLELDMAGRQSKEPSDVSLTLFSGRQNKSIYHQADGDNETEPRNRLVQNSRNLV